jgi:ribonuclease HI
MTTTTLLKLPEALLLRGEIIGRAKISKAQLNACLNDGMPHYLIGNEYRFLESEVLEWLKTYKPSQERLEADFRDKKGRSLEEYVTQEVILSTLRITKERLVNLRKNGLPFQRVGEKDFYHVSDILDYYRKGVVNAGVTNEASMQELLMPICENVPRNVPFIIVDGSYKPKNSTAGTGLVIVRDRNSATGYSTVRKVKTTKPIVCEMLAILDALKLMKKKKVKKAIIITDQKAWTSSFSIDMKAYEGPVKQYINELNQLWNQLKGKVEIKFVGELSQGKESPLYKKAHNLSQEHRTSIIGNIKFE